MSKMPEVYEGYASSEKDILHYSKAVRFEMHSKHQPINILRIRRVYDKKPINFWFKSKNKIKDYRRVRVIVEYLD